MDLQNFVFPITSLLSLAAVTEAIVEIIKTAVPVNFSDNGKTVLALAVSVALAFVFNVSLISVSGPTYFVGVLLAGLVSSRGSNYIHSLANVLGGLGKK